MRKKIISVLAATLLFCACILALASCGENEPVHTHNYSTLKFDNETHWFECECEEKNNIASHNIKSGQCACGYVVPHSHEYSMLKTDATKHWHECVCGDKENIQNHIPSADATETTAQSCTICEYVITPALGHVHTLHLTKVDANAQSCTEEGNIEYYTCDCGKWFTNNTVTTEITDKASIVIAKDKHTHTILKHSEIQHWYECVCGDKDNIESHKGGSATCTTLAKCSVCDIEYGGYTPHPYESKWTYNETQHWRESTCDCKIKTNLEGHTPEDSGWCSVCEKAILPTNGIYYEISDDNTYAKVVAYLGTAAKVNIASTYNGVPVTSIYSNAFKNTAITTVIIPDSVTSIGSYAFSECSALSSVEIGNGVTSIGTYAFNGCRSLTNVKIGNSTTSIGDYAFYNCKNLSCVEIPDSVTSIGSWAFYGCSNLTSIEISDNLSSIGYSAFRACSNLVNVVIPDSVTFIDSFAFSNCSALTSLTIPYGVRHIGRGTFFGCANITSVIIPDTVTSIYQEAFYNCDRLTSITIPESVTSIGENAFYGCVSLAYNTCGNVKYLGNENNPYLAAISTVHTNFTNYELCEQTKIIAGGVFEHCARLSNIVIPDGVTSIGNYAFYNCTSLTDITIPNGVTNIGNYAFYNCTNITSIIIPDTTISIGRYAFENSAYYNDSANWQNGVLYIGKHLIKANGNIHFTYEIKEGTLTIASAAFSGHSLNRVTIPDSVTLIGSYVFDGCKLIYTIKDGVKYLGNSNNPYLYLAGVENTSITTVTIDSNCKIIGDSAFYGCDKLTNITIPDSVISIGEDAFYKTEYYNDESNWNNGVLYIGKHHITIKTPSLGV